MPVPIYVIAHQDSTVRPRTATLGARVEVFESLDAWSPWHEREPGLLLVDAEGAHEPDLFRLAVDFADHPDEWMIGIVGGDAGSTVRSLSFGPATSLDQMPRLAADPSEARDVLIDLRRALVEIARVRHDVNNPLTAALAEVQLLLFDIEDEESRESLTITQNQLRRIRDMMASTTHLRPVRH